MFSGLTAPSLTNMSMVFLADSSFLSSVIKIVSLRDVRSLTASIPLFANPTTVTFAIITS